MAKLSSQRLVFGFVTSGDNKKMIKEYKMHVSLMGKKVLLVCFVGWCLLWILFFVTLVSNNYLLYGIVDAISYLHSVLFILSNSSLFKGPLDVGHPATGHVPPSPSTVAQYSLFQSGWNVPLTSAALSHPGMLNFWPSSCRAFSQALTACSFWGGHQRN